MSENGEETVSVAMTENDNNKSLQEERQDSKDAITLNQSPDIGPTDPNGLVKKSKSDSCM